MKILLIIPAYNEENCITKVIDELVERYPQYDYIIVNDGSTDHTSEICHKSGYEIIDLPINLGLAGAFQTGLKYAYLKNYDYAMRMLGSNMISWAIHMTTGVRVMDPTSGMRIFNRNMIKEFASNINYGPEPDTISFLLKQGAKIGEVQVKMAERIAGESYLNFTKSIWYMTKMLISIIVLQNFRKRKYEVEIINSEEVER